MTTATSDIYIIGAGGLGREILTLIRRINTAAGRCIWAVKGFVDQNEAESVENLPVLADAALLAMNTSVTAVIAVGLPSVRAKIIAKYAHAAHIGFPNLLDPSALILNPDRVVLGDGNIICAGTILTTDIELGRFNILNVACTVGHDVVLGDNNIINPSANISGSVAIGNNCFVGTGAQILQQLQIGDGAVIGAGAVVLKHVEPWTTVVGVPAKKIKEVSAV